MKARHYIVATAGHVDHGKSSLVKALTGVDPDRLPEEKARGITIDLGFAHLALEGTLDGAAAAFHLGIVDVPGHEDFVKNMVAGVGSIDLAFIIVAADDGWMPQTEEHLQILSYLGVKRAVLALTKIDLAPDPEAAESGIREQLKNSPFVDAPIIRTSVMDGTGVGELKSALWQTLAQVPPPRDIGKPRLSVDRVFMLRGIGQVVTGTLSGGQLRKGQEVVVQPSGKTGRIRSLQNHNREVEFSVPGTRTAINLPDLKGGADAAVHRGDVVTLPSLGIATSIIDVVLEKSARLANSKNPAARPLKDGTRVRLHIGSSDVPGHLTLMEGHPLHSGERQLAQLRLESRVFAFTGDHFILRDWSEQATLAGGVVLDPHSATGRFKTHDRRTFLQERAESSAAAAFVMSELRRSSAVRPAEVLVQSRFSAEEIRDAFSTLAAQKQIVLQNNFALEVNWWNALVTRGSRAVDRKHSDEPAAAGLPVSELKSTLQEDLPRPELFELVIADLCRSGFTQSNSVIRRSSHRPRLPAELLGAGEKLRKALTAMPLEPPSRKELAPDKASQQALRFLIESGEAVEVSPDIILDSEAFARARQTVESFLRKTGPAGASELRQALGSSRRIVIPLLEKLDKDGVTRREGDKRVLRGPFNQKLPLAAVDNHD